MEAAANNSYTTRALAGIGLASLAVGALFVALIDPTKVNFLPVCPLLKLTGLACPGCGLTRGFHALFHGEIVTALDFNALIPLWAGLIGIFAVSLLMFTVRGKAFSIEMFRPWMFWVFLGVLLAFAVLRNIPAYPFSVLYP
ncbi:MAG: DUF2752 domain-containing protein [Pyrinomonadaceae bacterium]